MRVLGVENDLIACQSGDDMLESCSLLPMHAETPSPRSSLRDSPATVSAVII